MQESIIRYSGIASGIYEEMEVFDDEFYVESALTRKNLPERSIEQHSSKNRTGTMLGCQC